MNHAPAPRYWPLVLGLAILAAAWLGPLPGWAPASFVAHMTMHVSVVAVAAPLLAIGLGGSRLDPARRWPGLFAALPLSAVELVVVWAWHAPALHHLSRHHPAAMAVEQGSFLVAGLAVWLAAFGGDPQLRPQRAGPGIAALLMTATHMTLLGVLLALAPRPLFAGHGSPLFGLDAMRDQEIGGVLMLVAGGSSYLIGGLYLLATLLVATPRRAAPDRRSP